MVEKQVSLLENNAFNDLSNKTIEDFVLGTFINFPETYYDYSEYISDKEFNSTINKLIFTSIQELGKSSKIDIGTLLAKIRENNYHETIKKLSGIGYDEIVTNLAEQIQSSEHIQEHVKLLKTYSQRRALDLLAKTIYTENTEHKDIQDIISKIGSEIVELQQNNEKEEFNLFNTIKIIYDEIHGNKEIEYIRSYLAPLDKFMYGWEKGDFVIIAAAPSMGKTTLALEIAKNKSLRKEPIIVFSLEMKAEQLLKRMIACESAIPYEKLRNRLLLTDIEKNELDKTIGKVENATLFIDDKARKLYLICSKIKKYVLRYKTKLVIIDYLQLITFDGKGANNREQEIAKISRTLKELASELSIVIVGLSQINRAVNARANKRPTLSDLRESGSLEQDADMVIFCYRELYYDMENSLHIQVEDAELIVAKGRNTGTGIIKLKFIPKIGKFCTEDDIVLNEKLQTFKNC